MEFEIAKEKAITYLVRAKKTEKQVRLKLKQSGYSSDVIDQVILYLKELGYLDDNEYVDAYMRQCMRLPNDSIYEIKNKLLQKGIQKDIIEKKIQILEESDYEQNVIKKLLNGKLKTMEDRKKRQYLYRRGFQINSDLMED